MIILSLINRFGVAFYLGAFAAAFFAIGAPIHGSIVTVLVIGYIFGVDHIGF